MDHIPERTEKSAAGLKILCEYVIQHIILDIVKDNPDKTFRANFTMAEIGVWTGAGTKIFVKYFSRVVAVDPWAAGPEIASQYDMKRVEAIFDGRFIGNGKVVKMKMSSLRAAEQFGDETLDVVYIDAIHAYKSVKADIMAWAPKVRRGGFLCGHDYSRRFPGVMQAVDELRGGRHKTFPDTSWAVAIC